MRAAGAMLLGLFACGPTAPPEEPRVPDAPVLAPLREVTPFSTTVLSGGAEEGTVVRVYVDEACAGPVLRQVTAAELAAGVTVELVPRAENVFAARAWSGQGARSACSAPVRTRFEPQPPPPGPDVVVSPPPPAQTTRFWVSGHAPGADVVRLYESGCPGTPSQTLSRAAFEERGFFVQVVPNTFQTRHVVSVAEAGATSPCVQVPTLLADTLPPTLSARLASPMPVGEPTAYAVVETDSVLPRLDFFRAPHCVGPSMNLGMVFSTRSLVVVFANGPDAATRWSLRATDQVGNSTCVDGDEPVVWDSLAPPHQDRAPTLAVDELGRIVPRVPVYGDTWLQFFTDERCTVRTNAYRVDEALTVPMFFVSGTYSARLERNPAWPHWSSPCSNAVTVP